MIIMRRFPRQMERVWRSVEQFDALLTASVKNYLLLQKRVYDYFSVV